MKKLGAFLLAALFLAPAAFAQKEYGLKFSSLMNDNLTLENAIRLGLENNSDFLTAKHCRNFPCRERPLGTIWTIRWYCPIR